MPPPAHSSTTTMDQSTSIPDSDNLDPSSSGLVKIPFFIFVTILLFTVIAAVGFCVWLGRYVTKPPVSQHTKSYGRGMTRWREWKEVDTERVGILRQNSKLGRREMARAYGSQDSIFKRVRFSEEILKMEEGRGGRRTTPDRQERLQVFRTEDRREQEIHKQQTEMLAEGSMRDERTRAMKLAIKEEARRSRALEARRNAISKRVQDENSKQSIEGACSEADKPTERNT